MQHSPIIEYQHPSRRQLLPVLVLFLLQQRIKLSRGIVPHLHLFDRQLNTRAVRRVPAHTQQVAGRWIVFKHGESAVRLDGDSLITRRVRVDIDG